MKLSVYIFAKAKTVIGAKERVRGWLIKHVGREFFRLAHIEEAGAKLLEDVPVHELNDAWQSTQQQLPVVEADIARCKVSGDRDTEGYSHIRYGNILRENFCFDMPYFNVENGDWSVPNKVSAQDTGVNWYAVMVNFNY
jgi:hypothetical protein